MTSGSTDADRGGGTSCRLTVGGVWPGVVEPGRRGIPEMLPLLVEEGMDRCDRGDGCLSPAGGERHSHTHTHTLTLTHTHHFVVSEVIHR